MKIIDISDPLCADMLRYPSVKPFVHRWVKDYSMGDCMSMSSIEMVIHNGTHLDAPYHYVKDADRMEHIPLERFFGPVQVLEVDTAAIDVQQLCRWKITQPRVLLRTPFSQNIRKNQPGEASYLTKEGAQYLLDQQVELVGIDSFSVDKERDQAKQAHKILLGGGVLLLEGICLEGVASGEYQLVCFPLSIREAEAAPCRAVLIDVGGDE